MIEIQTTECVNIKKIFGSCPHYDEITNYEFDYNDKVTMDLIYWYKDLVFACDINKEEELKIMSQIDSSLYLYIGDNKFRNGLKDRIDINGTDLSSSDINKYLIERITSFTEEYEEMKILNITSSKWL